MEASKPVSFGIYYYGTEHGIISMRQDQFEKYKVIVRGFIVGIQDQYLLRPIFDFDRRAVIVRLRDQSNIALTPREARVFPYNRSFHHIFNYIESNAQYLGEAIN